MDRCFICGRTGYLETHHMMNGAFRKKSEKYDLLCKLCRDCHYRVHHQEGTTIKALKAEAQRRFEQTHSREEWMREFGRNYL